MSLLCARLGFQIGLSLKSLTEPPLLPSLWAYPTFQHEKPQEDSLKIKTWYLGNIFPLCRRNTWLTLDRWAIIQILNIKSQSQWWNWERRRKTTCPKGLVFIHSLDSIIKDLFQQVYFQHTILHLVMARAFRGWLMVWLPDLVEDGVLGVAVHQVARELRLRNQVIWSFLSLFSFPTDFV